MFVVHRIAVPLAFASVVSFTASVAMANEPSPSEDAPPPPPATSHNDGYTPYVYERNGNVEKGTGQLETESAYGSRQTSFMAGQGFEQILRGRYAPLNWLTLEGQVAMLVDTAEGQVEGVSPQADLTFGALRQDRHWINMSLGAGYRYDYLGRSLPRLRFAISRDFGPVDVRLWTLVEFPLGGRAEEEEEANVDPNAPPPEEEEGEVADFVVGTAISYRAAKWSRVGAEALLEDLEGFYEEEENEGGARLVVGPTLWFAIGRHFELKANAGPVVQLTNNTPKGGGTAPPDVGFLGRLAFAYVF